MAPHMTEKEVDAIRAKAGRGVGPVKIHEWIAQKRRAKRQTEPDLTTVRNVIKVKTFRRGVPETRGRKCKWTARATRKANAVRKDLIKKAKCEAEVTWGDVVKKARVPRVHDCTAKRSFKRLGIAVTARRPRERPQRERHQERERAEICRRWRFLPANHFTEKVDLIIDNKKWPIPTNARGRRFLKTKSVRFHLRTRSEGIKKHFTKPNGKKNRINPGASVNVCAGISNGRIAFWHYLPSTWNATVAAATYRGPILRALRRCRGEKDSYLLLEDNDPSGYKSKKACEAKAEVGIRTMEFPRYSPELNPMDYFVWNEINTKMLKSRVKGFESIKKYKARLRRTAMSLPRETVLKAVASLKKRAQAVYDAQGGDIARDA